VAELAMTLLCHLRSLIGSLSMAAFWRSLLDPPLVVFDGHVWEEGEWERAYDWNRGGHIEILANRCAVCGHISRDTWRRWWGTT
jgi:hypothetical protein